MSKKPEFYSHVWCIEGRQKNNARATSMYMNVIGFNVQDVVASFMNNNKDIFIKEISYICRIDE